MSNSLLTELWKERSERNKKNNPKSISLDKLSTKSSIQSLSKTLDSDEEIESSTIGGKGGGGGEQFINTYEKSSNTKSKEISSDEDDSSSDFIDLENLEKVRKPDPIKKETLVSNLPSFQQFDIDSHDSSDSASSAVENNIFDIEKKYQEELEKAIQLSKKSSVSKINNKEEDIMQIVEEEDQFQNDIQKAIELSEKNDDIDKETLDIIKAMEESEE